MSDRRIHRVRVVNARLKPEWRPRVSDHAMARYIERVFGIEVTTEHFKEARKAMVSKAVETAIMYGAGAAVLDGGIKIVVEDNHVVTVLGPSMKPKLDKSQKRTVLRQLSRLNELYPLGAE